MWGYEAKLGLGIDRCDGSESAESYSSDIKSIIAPAPEHNLDESIAISWDSTLFLGINAE